MNAKYYIQDDVRQALLDAARSIFARYGYNKTTVDEIAKAARKGKSTFYYYYKSKEEIFRDVIEKEAQIFRMKLIESISTSTDPVKKIKSYIISRLGYFKKLVNFYSVLKNEGNEHFVFIEEVRSKYDLEQLNIIKMIFLEAIQSNLIELDDIELASESVALVLKGLEYHLMFGGDDASIEETKIDKIINMIFKGMYKR